MTDIEKENAIVRIMSGEYIIHVYGSVYIIKNPSRSLRYQAQEFLNRFIEKNRYAGFLTNEEVLSILYDNGLWSKTQDLKFDKLSELIDDTKIALYKSYLQPDKQIQIRTQLNIFRKQYNEMAQRRHSYDLLMLEGYAQVVKQQFLIQRTIYDTSGRLLDIGEDYDFLETAVASLSQSKSTISEFRELARTEPWRSIWGAGKENVFGSAAVDLTEEQRTLIVFSNMYDNVYGHHESPDDIIINDDDMLDGWMIEQRRKREQDKKTKLVDTSISDIHQGSQEVFIPVKDRKTAQEIMDLNSLEGKMIQQQREAAIKSAGKLKDSQLPDKQMEIAAKTHELMKR